MEKHHQQIVVTRLGDNVTLPCASAGADDDSVVEWYKDGAIIYSAFGAKEDGHAANTYRG
jgi:hypothetical protein